MGDTTSLTDVLLFMGACVVIQHFLLHKKKDDALDKWFYSEDNNSKLDDCLHLTSDDEFNEATPDAADGDLCRRQLMYCVEETRYDLILH